MGTGYTRQSGAQIVDEATIEATHFNNEYDALQTAFDVTTGHTHDGTAGEGALVPLIASPDGYNAVTVDDANNRVVVSVDVSSVKTDKLYLNTTAIQPVTTAEIDLGTSSFRFKDSFFSGDITTAGDVIVTGTVTAAAPTLGGHLTNKTYIDTLYGSTAAAAVSAAAALVSEGNAATSETNAASSASAASTSASNASTSETNASTSASNASTSETNAATSETNAATSEANAATSASTATAKEILTNADAIATAADAVSTAADAVSTAADAAAASTSASNASTSETNAATSETNAAASAASIDTVKLAGIETGATTDQTGAEIKTAYESETNAFTDAQFNKLADLNEWTQTDKGSVASGTVTFDVSVANAQKLTVTGGLTIAFSNWATTGTYSECEVELVNGSTNVTMPTVNWAVGDGTTSTTFADTGITLSAAGTNHLIVWTTDGGTTLYGAAS